MTQLELFNATTRHTPHSDFLFYMQFTPDLERRIRAKYGLEKASLAKYFGMYSPKDLSLNLLNIDRSSDYYAYFPEIPENAFINSLGVLEVPGSMYHFTRYVSPLRNAESFQDLESFPYHNVKGFSYEDWAKEAETAHSLGQVVSCWVGHMYEDAWQIRGYEQFLMDMVIRPHWCEYILDRITERNLSIATAAARAGADIINTGDDVANQNNMMFSVEHWRKIIKPRWAKVYSEAKRIKPDIQIYYHSDGNIEAIIPELIEIGVTVLNPVQPECLDPVMVKKRYGDKLVLDGTVGTQTTMPFASPSEVRQVVQERINTLGEDGALILSPTHILEPDVPIDNIVAFVEAVKEYGG